MNLDFFKKVENNFKNIDIKEFINDLSEYLKNNKEKSNSPDEEIIKENKLSNLRIEDCLYQVVDFSLHGVYLQNKNNNVIFEETNIPEELKNIISNDYILRYKNGTYIYEKELTKQFFEKLI